MIAIETVVKCDQCAKEGARVSNTRIRPLSARLVSRHNGYKSYRWKSRKIDLCPECQKTHPAAGHRKEQGPYL